MLSDGEKEGLGGKTWVFLMAAGLGCSFLAMALVLLGLWLSGSEEGSEGEIGRDLGTGVPVETGVVLQVEDGADGSDAEGLGEDYRSESVFEIDLLPALSGQLDVIFFLGIPENAVVSGAFLQAPSGERYGRYYFYDNGDERYLCFSVDRPPAGVWTLSLSGDGQFRGSSLLAYQYMDFMKLYSRPYSEVNNEERTGFMEEEERAEEGISKRD